MSTALRAVLPGGSYRCELLDFFNMSYLQANASYSGAGGSAGVLNEAQVQWLQIVAPPNEP
ncbi:MAG: hypothetical protein WCH44_11230 [Betaproteobacteria bacterium]